MLGATERGHFFMTVSYPSWYQNAKCGNDPRLFEFMRVHHIDPFFDLPKGYTTDFLENYCRSCPVISQCRSYAVETNQFGGWGGQTHKKRTRQMHDQNKRYEEIQKQMRELQLGVKNVHSAS